MKTIAHVNSETGYSGGEAQMFLLMDGLRERGYTNVVICPPDSESTRTAKRLGFEAFEIPMRNDLDWRAVLRIARVLKDHRVDLAQLHTGRATWLGGLAGRRAKVPSVTTRRMDRRVKPGLRTHFIYEKCVAHTIAISTAVKACLLEPGIREEKISVVWDAVEPEKFVGEAKVDLRKSEGIESDTVLMLTMAALVHRKGIDVFVDALSLLKERGTSFRAWIGGDGAEREALETQINARGLSEQVRLLGWREDKLDLLKAADISVLSSRREGVGVAALEAMASGTAVVASRVGGLGEVVEDGATGLLVSPDNPAALADALQRLAENEELRSQYGAKGAERVRDLYSADTLVDGYVEIYEKILSSRGSV